MAGKMAKQYDPSLIEDTIYAEWEKSGVFHAEVDSEKEPYSIMIPPPNVTGALHMGHGLNNTIQDILIRYHKMCGYNTLWMPGTDHAGIATQNVVERKLAREGKERHEIGRERFIEEVWKWKEKHGSTIIRQLKKLGASCDWERERFTMDEGLSRAVKEVFVSLHEKELIYKGEYIINWCPRCGTALAEEEVEHQDIAGTFTHIRYPFANGRGGVIVATTRPETMLGDTAVAVHPNDERYKDKIGKMLKLPLSNREIPLIADEHVDMNFGTGAVKVTPAHDPNDFEIGNRQGLPRIKVMREDGTMNENAPEKYHGMDRFECRKNVVEDLKAAAVLIKQEAHQHSVGHCYRCDTVVEPYLSRQWFVKMGPLAEPAIKAVDEGKITFYTERWKKVYLNWMNNIRDWCISRQIWWGHQIPAWYAVSETDGAIINETPFFVARTEEKARKEAEEKYGKDVILKQDPDVLDTWFSSWLWPFSTLGWPDNNADLAHFYPTSVLSTDMGIIFFWVARMIMAGYFCMGEIPFTDVYIHGTVMDDKGRKMSKSLGNGIDPLEVIKEYGADALRYTMIAITPQGQNTLLSIDKFQIGSRFANKMWNASRYILMNMEGKEMQDIKKLNLEFEDRWIISSLQKTAQQVRENMASYRLNDVARGLAHFFRDDFCDWYIEFSKKKLYGDNIEKKQIAVSVLGHVLKQSLKLLHPIMPFITEEIYQKLPNTNKSIILTHYPLCDKQLIDEAAEESMLLLQQLISGIRNVRAEMRVPPGKKCSLTIKTDDPATQALFKEMGPQLESLAKIESVEYTTDEKKPAFAATGVGKGYEFFIPLEGLIDMDAEKARLEKELSKLEGDLKRTLDKLSSSTFTDKAPEAVVAREKEKAAYCEEKIEKLKANLDTLS